MVKLTKLLKNATTQSMYTVMGKEMYPGDTYNLPSSKWLDAVDNDYVKELIDKGNIVVNDGTNDLIPNQGRSQIETLAPLDSNSTSKKSFFPQFQFSGVMDWTQYLVSWVDNDTQKNRLRRSGSPNGLKNTESSTILCPMNGTLLKVIVSIRGAACSTSTPNNSCQLKFELWDSGFNDQGEKLTDIIFNMDNETYPIGREWDSEEYDTNFSGICYLNTEIPIYTKLALKFVQQYGDDKIIEVRGTTLTLDIVEA